MDPKTLAEGLLEKADIRIHGERPWDMQVKNERVFRRVMGHQSLGLGEAYQDGDWECDDLSGFFCRILSSNISKELPVSLDLATTALKARLQNRQSPALVKQAAEVHYDLPAAFFKRMYADSRITGSCGYWKDATTLEEAQVAKLDLVSDKAYLEPGQLVWDIGCGWGAWMSRAAETRGVRCVGVTISKEQAAYGSERYAHLPIEFRVEDYRAFRGKVDRIVSMGMFEHVGHKNYREYFECARRAIHDDGLFVLHTIWADKPESHIDPWLDKYIFPNGVIPTIGQIATATHGLFKVLDVHNFGPYYDLTLMAWSKALEEHKAWVVAELGETMYRTQQYYLLQCAGGFRAGIISVGQLVLTPVAPHGSQGVYHAVR
jgi:cyclopropane-fatty-acyl-phospholipid synthase